MEDPRRQAPALLSRRRNELQAERQRIVQQGLYVDPTPSDSEWNSDDEDQFSYSQASDISFASTTGTFTPGLLRDVPVEQRGDVPLPEPQENMPLAGRTRGARSRQASTAGGGGAPLTGQTLEWLNQTNGVAEPPRRLESVSSFASSNGASIVASPSATGASAGAGWLQSSSTFGLARESFLFASFPICTGHLQKLFVFVQRTYITCLSRYTRRKRRGGCGLKVVDRLDTWGLGLTVFRLLLVMCIFISFGCKYPAIDL